MTQQVPALTDPAVSALLHSARKVTERLAAVADLSSSRVRARDNVANLLTLVYSGPAYSEFVRTVERGPQHVPANMQEGFEAWFAARTVASTASAVSAALTQQEPVISVEALPQSLSAVVPIAALSDQESSTVVDRQEVVRQLNELSDTAQAVWQRTEAALAESLPEYFQAVSKLRFAKMPPENSLVLAAAFRQRATDRASLWAWHGQDYSPEMLRMYVRGVRKDIAGVLRKSFAGIDNDPIALQIANLEASYSSHLAGKPLSAYRGLPPAPELLRNSLFMPTWSTAEVVRHFLRADAQVPAPSAVLYAGDQGTLRAFVKLAERELLGAEGAPDAGRLPAVVASAYWSGRAANQPRGAALYEAMAADPAAVPPPAPVLGRGRARPGSSSVTLTLGH